jgi:hypothetical protein
MVVPNTLEVREATMRTRAIVVTLAVLLLPSAAAAQRENRFQLFGQARQLTSGLPPNGSVHLTSHCDPYDPVNNPAPCGDNFDVTFSGIHYRPRRNLTFAQIRRLSARFNVNASDCGGGSPRFQINVDTDADGAADGTIFVYFGPSPSFTTCRFGWQSTGNLVGNTDPARWDATQLGVSPSTYAQILTVLGDASVVGIQLVVDGGWTHARGQAVDVDTFRVNDDVLRRVTD